MSNLEMLDDLFETIMGLNRIGLMTEDDMDYFLELRNECIEEPENTEGD